MSNIIFLDGAPIKSRYQQIYELLTPMIISGGITTGELASLLALISLAEKEAFERGLNGKPFPNLDSGANFTDYTTKDGGEIVNQ